MAGWPSGLLHTGIIGTALLLIQLSACDKNPSKSDSNPVLLQISASSLDFSSVAQGTTKDLVVEVSCLLTSNKYLNVSIGITGTTFSIVTGGGTISIKPGSKHSVVIRFAPSSPGSYSGTLSLSHNATNRSSPATISLSGTCAGYTVSGTVRVRDGEGTGIGSVTISFSSGHGSVTTASNGTWSKSGLSGSVTVTPSLSGWSFTPTSRTVTAAASNVDFTVRELRQQIAFRSFLPMTTVPDCGLCDDIYIMNDRGGNLRRLTTDKGEEIEPTWSPDGSRIAYAGVSHSMESNNGIFVINFDGTGEEQLYRIEYGQVRYPNWSPDGTKIAFTYVDYAEWMNGIAVLDLESRVVTQLTGDFCYACFANGSSSWSPDGSKIVFDAYRNNSTDIWVMNSDGTGQEKIYSGGGWPDWSPDGLEIVFVSGGEIYTMKIGDGSIAPVTGGFRDYQPDWSPDGQRIAFMRGEQIYIVNKDGSGLTHLPIQAHSEAPSWRPRQ